jgi:ATP-dependent DNA helicase RecQ
MGDTPAIAAPELDLDATLRERFGLAAFREGQREVIEAVLRGEDALVVRPTGSGKSLCYQLPALLVPGVTVVVSPLIALMKDQRDALAARGLPVIAINSALDPEEAADALGTIRSGRARMVLVAPERFRSAPFLGALASVDVSLLAVDEAHCVSEWGHEFRPDYRRLGAVREALGAPTVIALTATATPRVRRDILDQLGIPRAKVSISGFDRPNLHFEVARVSGKDDKLARLRGLVRAVAGDGAGIIYCASRKDAEEVAARLRIGFYHARLEPDERTRVQNAFKSGECNVLAATNAFGMGIDRPDVRFVAHYSMPRSLEAYYQEAGRAGRDGGPARCVLMYNYADRRVHDFMIEESCPEREQVEAVWRGLAPESGAGVRPGLDAERIAEALARGGRGKPRVMAAEAALKLLEKAGHVELLRDRGRPLVAVREPCDAAGLKIDWTLVAARRAHEGERLEKVIAYASRQHCRMGEILRYFGERSPVAQKSCGHCDGCGAEAPAIGAGDASGDGDAAGDGGAGDDGPGLPRGGEERLVVARKVLSAVARIGRGATRTQVSCCLAGSRAAKVAELGHDRLSTYGLLRGIGRDGVLAWLDALARAGLVSNDHGRVSLTAAGIEVMAGRAALPPLDAEAA